jgi:hypothetical protein
MHIEAGAPASQREPAPTLVDDIPYFRQLNDCIKTFWRHAIVRCEIRLPYGLMNDNST